jgi:hypothetical protein
MTTDASVVDHIGRLVEEEQRLHDRAYPGRPKAAPGWRPSALSSMQEDIDEAGPGPRAHHSEAGDQQWQTPMTVGRHQILGDEPETLPVGFGT